MIKQIGEIKNKCIYNDKNAYLSIPLLMMSPGAWIYAEKKKWGKDDENETEKKSCLSKAAKAKWTTSTTTNSFKIMHTCLFLSL